MACDPNQLANDARCLEQCIPEGSQLPVLILLAQKIAGDTRTPQQLIADAQCIEYCVPPGMRIPVLINLACKMVP